MFSQTFLESRNQLFPVVGIMADMLSANNEKRRNLIYNVLNGNKHGAANGYDKELFADNIS